MMMERSSTLSKSPLGTHDRHLSKRENKDRALILSR
jgi:hypothetical protein